MGSSLSAVPKICGSLAPAAAAEAVPEGVRQLRGEGTHAVERELEVALAAVRADGVALQFVPGSIDDYTGEQRLACIDGYFEIAANALQNSGMAGIT